MPAAHGALWREVDDATISSIEAMRADGRYLEAQDRYGDIVRRHQRRAMRIANQCFCNPADTDEVVQDAFVKAYIHLPSFQRQLPFEIWFTRILTNGCRDRIKRAAAANAALRRPRAGRLGSEISGRMLQRPRRRRNINCSHENAAKR